MLIYVKTLRESDWFIEDLAKVSQSEWWEMSISSFLLLLVKLRMVCMVNHRSSWMNTILEDAWISRIVLTIRLFLQTFWEKSFKIL